MWDTDDDIEDPLPNSTNRSTHEDFQLHGGV